MSISPNILILEVLAPSILELFYNTSQNTQKYYALVLKTLLQYFNYCPPIFQYCGSEAPPIIINTELFCNTSQNTQKYWSLVLQTLTFSI